MENEDNKQSFDFLKSKIQELHIPLPNFEYFHKPFSEKDVFDNFIGREEESERLEEWLINDDSGAYLVTGYRGMGKSSFVGRVLNKITRKTKNKLRVPLFTFFCFTFILTSVLLVFIRINYCDFWENNGFGWKFWTNYTISFTTCPEGFEWLISVFTISILGGLSILLIDLLRKRWYNFKRMCYNIKKTDYKKHKTWFEKVFSIRDIKENKRNLVIKLNLGHETLKEKDILSLIAKRIYETYKDYLNSFYTNGLKIIIKTIFLFVGAILIVKFLDIIRIAFVLPKSSDFYQTIHDFLTLTMWDEQHRILNVDFFTPLLVIKIILVLVFYFLVKRIYNFLISQIHFLHKRSTTAILIRLRFLIDRIEAAVTEDSGPNSGYTHSTSLFSINFSRRKHKTYPNASPREIETELIQILEKIRTTRSLLEIITKKKLCKKILSKLFNYEKIHIYPRFIIVFDELDKIDPVYNNAVKVEQNIPEYDASTAFQGGSVSRDRKQNVLKLLGNMKQFMSQAKAKFVFISGRELYDAYLADLADREFAVSSIFNGVIYVDSFLFSSTKQKNILTKTEEYICGYLIPKKWYKQEARKQYYKESGRKKNIVYHLWWKITKKWKELIREQIKTDKILCEKLDHKIYRQPNLRIYKNFLIETLLNNYLKEKLNVKDKKWRDYIAKKIENSKFRSYKEFKSKEFENKEFYKRGGLIFSEYKGFAYPKYSIKVKDLFKNDLQEIEQLFLFIDKVIVFLNQFSIYLTHICNGSPKKITIYFEKYINLFISGHEKNPFSHSKNKDIKNTKYCLSFDATNQQKIGFIYYITYPIIQSVVNQATHFGDKVLVSVSFLIDHIFKHHKGGFSYENIEHTPELLEVYHIPNLRSTIDTLLLFLRQNHITDICGGIYQYKFRKSIADEIQYNSRVSEEISAIFNFTLDESLPVKRYYYKQIEDSEKKYLALEARTEKESIKNQYAATLISQLEALAEIHLLDEEYNEAIQHFQTAFEIIKAEIRDCKDDKNKLHLYVLLNKTALKLGLANERKGYYNEAFVIYNTLLDYLVEFRSLKEEELGLNYFYEDNNIVDNNGEWKTKKTKIFHSKDGQIIKQNPYNYFIDDNFYTHEVLPFYRDNSEIKKQEINFLMASDDIVFGLSTMISPKKQEIISRLTLFSEVKSVSQAILANLFIIEKIDVNGITQDNLDLAEDQFKYIYLLTDSKEKILQAADFYKKMASILFLKNYSNPKPNEYLKMWGFDTYEAINEFCFIYSADYNGMIAGKFPKEILKEFLIDNAENLLTIFLSIKDQTLYIITLRDEYVLKIKDDIKEYVLQNRKDIRENILKIKEKKEKEKKIKKEQKIVEKLIKEGKEKINKLISDFITFGIKKRDQYFDIKQGIELANCKRCHEYCSKREFNHPCFACNNVSNSLDIFIQVFKFKYKEIKEPNFKKRKSYFLKFLKYLTRDKINSNYYFVFASALRIKADISLSCTNENNDRLSFEFLYVFLNFLTKYYNYDMSSIDDFIRDYIEENKYYKMSKLEKTILLYWLASEYFYLNNSPADSSECLTKILIIFDKYIAINKELYLLGENVKIDIPLSNNTDILFEKIQDTLVRRVLRNSSYTDNNVNHIELQNLKSILKYRPIMHINLSNLSTTANIEEVLFTYCKLELNSKDIDSKGKKMYLDCYKSTLLSPTDLSFTISEQILSLEFKEKMNMAIFKTIFEKKGKKLNFYDSDFQINYFSFLINYFDENYNIATTLPEISEILKISEIQGQDIDTKIRLLHFLISDSLYCLTKIIEVLSSGKFSNFSHSFMGDIYHQISKWATLYQLNSAVLPKYNKENDKGDINVFIQNEIKTMCNRKGEKEKASKKVFINKKFNDMDFCDYAGFYDDVKKVSEDIEKYYEDKNNQLIITNRVFETNILDYIGTGNRHFLIPNYSIAMALRHYKKVIEVHREGKEYKEMIKKMYIIDDDISNGMHCFSLALERYAMNCGIIEKKIERLRKYYKGSLSFPIENYLKDTSEFL